jgi:hypothetical protein
MDAGTYSTVLHSNTEFQPFSMAFGTLMFAIGGHPAFPTIQADMKKPGNFKWAVLLGFTGKKTFKSKRSNIDGIFMHSSLLK